MFPNIIRCESSWLQAPTSLDAVPFGRYLEIANCSGSVLPRIKDTGKRKKSWKDFKFSRLSILASRGPITRLKSIIKTPSLIKIWDERCIPSLIKSNESLVGDLLGRPNARNLWKDERAMDIEMGRNKTTRTWKAKLLHLHLVHLGCSDHVLYMEKRWWIRQWSKGRRQVDWGKIRTEGPCALICTPIQLPISVQCILCAWAHVAVQCADCSWAHIGTEGPEGA